ncbi:MAG: acetyl-CoA carboxylase [Pseudomonadota bacterium]
MAVEEIKAMLPGMFYRKPSPDEPPYKKEGDTVSKGDVIGLIEVMKSFHEVQSDVEGKIIAFKVDDAEPITPGAVLAEVET